MVQETNEQLDGHVINAVLNEKIQKYLDNVDEFESLAKKFRTKVMDCLLQIFLRSTSLHLFLIKGQVFN